MSEAILWLVVLGIICFIFLILRFFQPELIYTLRQAVVKVEISKAFLEKEAEKEGYLERYHRALAKDFRSESRRHDKRYIYQRLQKVKELYNLQEAINEEKNYQTCIVELSNLLSNIAQNLTLKKDYKYHLTYASEILKFLKEERIAKDNTNIRTVDANASIEEWFAANPISVEQSVEILVAIINALLIRESKNL